MFRCVFDYVIVYRCVLGVVDLLIWCFVYVCYVCVCVSLLLCLFDDMCVGLLFGWLIR